MVLETLQKSRLVDGDAEVSLQKQGDKLPCQILNGRCGKSGSDRNSARPCLDDNCGEDNTGVTSYRDVPSSLNIDMQPDTSRVSKLGFISRCKLQPSCNVLVFFTAL